MKKIMVLAAGVLMSTFAFASKTVAPTGSSVSVTNSGSDLIKVYYKAERSGNVTVAILNANQEVVYKEYMKSDGFMRPYNLKYLPAGEYTVQVTDQSGKQTEKISHGLQTGHADVMIAKLPSQEGKYVVTGFSAIADKINVRIYDNDGGLIFEKKYKVNGNFGDVYNLKDIKGAFLIEVSDANGSLKEFHS